MKSSSVSKTPMKMKMPLGPVQMLSSVSPAWIVAMRLHLPTLTNSDARATSPSSSGFSGYATGASMASNCSLRSSSCSNVSVSDDATNLPD